MPLATRSPQPFRSPDRDHPSRSSTLAPAPLAAVLDHQDLIDFPLRVVGRSTAPVVPQQVGDWWLEPITVDAELPLRARLRLDALLALGLEPKAVALFHEISETGQQPGLSIFPAPLSSLLKAGRQSGARFSRWAQQSLPVITDRLSDAARRHGPPLVRTLAHLTVRAAGLAALGLSVFAIAALGLIATALGAALADPCLIVVTADGYWIEIDRWDD
jgi:hypothetical protein